MPPSAEYSLSQIAFHSSANRRTTHRHSLPTQSDSMPSFTYRSVSKSQISKYITKTICDYFIRKLFLAQKCRRQSITFHRKPFIPLRIAEPHIVTIYPHNRIECQASLIGKFQNLKSRNKLLKWFLTSLLENCF